MGVSELNVQASGPYLVAQYGAGYIRQVVCLVRGSPKALVTQTRIVFRKIPPLLAGIGLIDAHRFLSE
jgi:hypothetical protein